MHFQGTNGGIDEDTDLFAGEYNVTDDAGLSVPANLVIPADKAELAIAVEAAANWGTCLGGRADLGLASARGADWRK